MQHELIVWEWARSDPLPTDYQFVVCLPCQKASVFVRCDGRAELRQWWLGELAFSPSWKRVPFDRVLEALR